MKAGPLAEGRVGVGPRRSVIVPMLPKNMPDCAQPAKPAGGGDMCTVRRFALVPARPGPGRTLGAPAPVPDNSPLGCPAETGRILRVVSHRALTYTLSARKEHRQDVGQAGPDTGRHHRGRVALRGRAPAGALPRVPLTVPRVPLPAPPAVGVAPVDKAVAIVLPLPSVPPALPEPLVAPVPDVAEPPTVDVVPAPVTASPTDPRRPGASGASMPSAALQARDDGAGAGRPAAARHERAGGAPTSNRGCGCQAGRRERRARHSIGRQALVALRRHREQPRVVGCAVRARTRCPRGRDVGMAGLAAPPARGQPSLSVARARSVPSGLVSLTAVTRSG